MDNQSTEQQPGLTVGLVIPLRNYAFDLILFVAGTFTASIPKAKPDFVFRGVIIGGGGRAMMGRNESPHPSQHLARLQRRH